jgi:hypothetical protein
MCVVLKSLSLTDLGYKSIAIQSCKDILSAAAFDSGFRVLSPYYHIIYTSKLCHVRMCACACVRVIIIDNAMQ